MSLNVKKTRYMLLGKHRNRKLDVKIVFDGHEIDQIVKIKFLGVVIDNNLNWKENVPFA